MRAFIIAYLVVGAVVSLTHPWIRSKLIELWQSEAFAKNLIPKLFFGCLGFVVTSLTWPLAWFNAGKSKKEAAEQEERIQSLFGITEDSKVVGEEDDQASEHDVPRNAAAEIDTILYSDRNPEEMLTALSPYIRLRDTVEAVCQRTGLTFRDKRRHIAAEPLYIAPTCGLCFSTPDAQIDKWGIVRIRRLERSVDGRLFPECDIGSFELPPYYRYASQEEAEAEAKLFSDAFRPACDRRTPILTRIWNAILGR
jgi:hypothetical protein